MISRLEIHIEILTDDGDEEDIKHQLSLKI